MLGIRTVLIPYSYINLLGTWLDMPIVDSDQPVPRGRTLALDEARPIWPDNLIVCPFWNQSHQSIVRAEISSLGFH